MYMIGRICGFRIHAETHSTMDANALAVILKSAMEMRWHSASELPPAMDGQEHSDRLIVEAPDWQERVLIGRYIHSLNEWRVEGSNSPQIVKRWIPLPKPMPNNNEIQAAMAEAK